MQNTEEIMRILDMEKTADYAADSEKEVLYECAAGCGAAGGSDMFFEKNGMKICRKCMTEEFREFLAEVCRENYGKSPYSDVLCGIADDLSDDDIAVHLRECFRCVR